MRKQNDYPAGKAEGRYVDAQLPTLPFADQSFDHALCSHFLFLFLYSAQLGEKFHRAAMLEMCRIARESRVFPLLALEASCRQSREPYHRASAQFLRPGHALRSDLR